MVNQQRMQRAADAAALAGAVYLPGDTASAYATARAEAARNGYHHQGEGVDVQPRTDAANPRRLIVDIEQPVRTFFARVFCWDGGPCLDEVEVGVQGRAEFVLPVPMGSPQNYYGVGYFVDATTTTTTATVSDDTGWRATDGFVAGRLAEPRQRGHEQQRATRPARHERRHAGLAGLRAALATSPTTLAPSSRDCSVGLTDISLSARLRFRLPRQAARSPGTAVASWSNPGAYPARSRPTPRTTSCRQQLQHGGLGRTQLRGT